MGIFDRFYYGKAGKRDYTESDMPKNRVSLFFLVLKDHLFDLIKVNLLQVVFWIPLFLWTFISVLAMQEIVIDPETQSTAQSWMSQLSSHLLIWLIGVIPCIAITGPSTAGAAYILRNWSKDQHAFLWSGNKHWGFPRSRESFLRFSLLQFCFMGASHVKTYYFIFLSF